jgi:protein Mpv17
MFLIGFLGPIMGRWNRYLEHRFPLRSQAGKGSASFTALSKRVVADQLVMAPIGVRPPTRMYLQYLFKL